MSEFQFGVGDTVRIKRDGHTTVIVEIRENRLLCYTFSPRERVDHVSPEAVDFVHGPRPEADEHIRRFHNPGEYPS